MSVMQSCIALMAADCSIVYYHSQNRMFFGFEVCLSLCENLRFSENYFTADGHVRVVCILLNPK